MYATRNASRASNTSRAVVTELVGVDGGDWPADEALVGVNGRDWLAEDMVEEVRDGSDVM